MPSLSPSVFLFSNMRNRETFLHLVVTMRTQTSDWMFVAWDAGTERCAVIGGNLFLVFQLKKKEAQEKSRDWFILLLFVHLHSPHPSSHHRIRVIAYPWQITRFSLPSSALPSSSSLSSSAMPMRSATATSTTHWPVLLATNSPCPPSTTLHPQPGTQPHLHHPRTVRKRRSLPRRLSSRQRRLRS
ncbi:MAG: hypothetical protein BYD32DRAFT_153496 [Podila humilis]|nr:MAG: hypothetical protein BYD32DRAFT_153496 [Podila humilis]